MDYKEYKDDELLYLISEDNEDAKQIIYEKYKYIIDIVFNKYKNMGKMLGLEQSDLYQEALLGFTDAINCYRDDKDAKLATFITLCVERRLQVAVIKAGRLKHKFINESLSLEQSYGDCTLPLRELISDNNVNNPLDNLMNQEDFNELLNNIKNVLSENEHEVFELMLSGFSYTEIATLLGKTPKSIDNSMQRIKTKVKKLLEQ